MRIRTVILALLITMLAACGGGGNASPGSQASAARASATAEPAGNGEVDCGAVKAAAQQLLAVQLLAQLKNAETIEQIKTKQIGNLDLDAFLAGMAGLHALDTYPSPLGDPKAAIDLYEEAGKAAQTLFATDPMTQAAIDTYNQKIGTVAEFLSHQIAISGAIDEAGC